MYKFCADANVSLRCRVKRKFVASTEYYFYGVGAYSSSYCYDFINLVCFLTKFNSLVKLNIKIIVC